MLRSIRYFFAAASVDDTRTIAKSFAKVVQTVAARDGQATVSFETIYSNGKTTWARAISEAIRANNDTFMYDQGHVLGGTKQAWEHWQSVNNNSQIRRIDRLAFEQDRLMEMKPLPPKNPNGQCINLVEWPWGEDEQVSFAYIQIAGPSEGTLREMCIKIDPQTDQMDEMDQFLEETAAFAMR